MVLNKKRIKNSFWRNFPARAKQMPSSFICRQQKATTAAVRSSRFKTLTTVNEFKIIIFELNNLTVLVYTKTIIRLSVGG